ncbi:GtrA family protein [Haloprofundus salinisoli]|uniref:GtrA family protein n=1 Tax=Haloprofundus salinisoli TaxID=2876193 RepID=UPI001CCF0067|nr:GtrA family protein [Haloprofundus salinisoli]
MNTDTGRTVRTPETRERLTRLGKFGLVGMSSFVVNVVVFALITPLLWYVVAGSLSWLIANVSSYNLNRWFTFDDTEQGYLRGYARHLSVYSVGFVVYLAGLWLFGLVVGTFAALALATAFSGVLNFVGSEFWVFRSES